MFQFSSDSINRISASISTARLLPRLLLLMLLLLQQPLTTASGRSDGRCHLRCGVPKEARGSTSLYDFTQIVWSQVQEDHSLTDMNITFLELDIKVLPVLEAMMDDYMEIGHKNVSTVIAKYSEAVAKATEKLGLLYMVTEDVDDQEYRPRNMRSVAPREKDVRKAVVDILAFYQWQEVAVFYDGPRGSAMVQTLALDPDIRVRAWRIGPLSTFDEIRANLLYVRQLPLTNIILIATNDTTSRVLDEDVSADVLLQYAYTQVNLLSMDLTEKNITAPSVISAHANDATRPATHTRANLLSLSLNFTETDLAQLSTHGIGNDATRPDVTNKLALVPNTFSKFEYVMLYDGLLGLYHTFSERTGHTCIWPGKKRPSTQRDELHFEGITGDVSIGTNGNRYDYNIKLIGFGERSLEEMGSWNSSAQPDHQLNLNQTALQTNYTMEYPIGKTTVRVVTILEQPFVQLKKNHSSYSGGDKLEGYCIDLLEALAKMLDFEYELYQVPDGTWNGLVEEVINGNASMIMASLTITSEREKVIDFSKPYKTLGISVVLKRPSIGRTVFEFMRPLSKYVWLLLLGTVFVAGITLYVIHRLLPSDSYGFHFGFQQSVWFTVASLFRRDTDVISISVAAKIVTGVLWFASIIIMSSFTANWAAHLTVSQFRSPVQSVTDLIEQTEIKYGTVRDTQVSAFFQNSKLAHLQKMWQFMSSLDPTTMVNSSEEGFAKVEASDEDYAFFWDSPVIDYFINEHCDLTDMGQPFDSRGYGIGVPLGANYRDDLTLAILKLGESGELSRIEEKWWKKGRCSGSDSSTKTSTQSLSMERVSGVFAIMAVAILITAPVSGLEYWNSHRQRTKSPKVGSPLPTIGFDIPTTPMCTVTEAPECESPPIEPHNIVFRNRASFRASHSHKTRQTNL